MRNSVIRIVFSVGLMLLPATMPVSSQEIRDEGRRQIFSLNDRWTYIEEDIADLNDIGQGNKQWERVTLPHTWNKFDVVDQTPGYRRSASWYRRELIIPDTKNELQYILDFEGINLKSDVYVNGVRAGGHVGGYVGFTVDITAFVKKGEKNTILIRADNSCDLNLIPSQKSDFCIYGGITRNVWLKVVPSRYIERLLIRTPAVSKRSAETIIDLTLRNASATQTMGGIDAVLRDRLGKEVARKSGRITLGPGSTSFSMRMPDITNPGLWSPRDPALYSVTVALTADGSPRDTVTDHLGYRWFEFKEHGPFFLNGERLLLRGTHRHEDYAGYANAMPDSLHRKDMVTIKEMGANFVRLAHYPQAREVYRACDELGILVWDELPWCRGGMGGEEWKSNTKRLLAEQILQNFNHPSIIIHSLGNELYWLPDFPGGDQVDSLRAMVKELNTIAHSLDPSRLTATRKFTEGADLVDLVSPSMWPGWYSGIYKNFETAIADARKNFKRFFHAEYGGDSHFGRHTETPVTGEGMTVPEGWEENITPQKIGNIAQLSDWSENYIVNLFDWYLHISEQTEWLSGTAQWALKDFPTPLRPENPIPYMNEKGLLDRSGHPKDAYYVFKSYWTTSPAFCYIESHTWTERSGPPDLKREVKVFSNCTEVELYLNGTSQGRRTRDIKKYPACGLGWQVNFVQGDNHFQAVGYEKGVMAALDTITVHYTNTRNGSADHLVLSSEQKPNGIILITALAVDCNGQQCLDYNKRIYFASSGPGRLFADYGTPTRSSVIEMANGKAQIEFEPAPGAQTMIEARNQEFKGAFVFVKNGSR